jgi:hypothetical protein
MTSFGSSSEAGSFSVAPLLIQEGPRRRPARGWLPAGVVTGAKLWSARSLLPLSPRKLTGGPSTLERRRKGGSRTAQLLHDGELRRSQQASRPDVNSPFPSTSSALVDGVYSNHILERKNYTMESLEFFFAPVCNLPGRTSTGRAVLNLRNRYRRAGLLAVALLAVGAFLPRLNAQSLDPNKPSPLQAGINKGTADNMVGPQYWFFTGGPGDVKVTARFKSMGFLGNTTNATITIILTDEKRTWKTSVPISGGAAFSEKTIPGKLDKKIKTIVEVVPPPNGLVRTGGDYQIEVTGAVEFSPVENTGVDPIVKTYVGSHGLSKFMPDGRVVTADGTEGKWTLFDADTRAYSVNYPGYAPESLKLVPGRGLVDAGNGTLVYTETHK